MKLINNIKSIFTKETFHNVFNSKNIFLNLLNSTLFIFILVCFFIFIISGTFLQVIIEKSEIIKLYADENPVFKEQLINNINADYDQVQNLAQQDKEKREENNKQLIINELLPYLIILTFLTIIAGLYSVTFGKNRYYKTADSILLFTLLFAFSTEIVFYFVVLRNWIYIGDQELMTRFIA